MRLAPKKGDKGIAGSADPREGETAEVIDLASRAAFPTVTDRKSTSDGWGLAAGVAIVFGLGAVTLWSMNAAKVDEAEPVGALGAAPPQSSAAAPAPALVPPPQPLPAPNRPDPKPAPILTRSPGAEGATSANPYASPTLTYDASAPAAGNAAAQPPAASAAGSTGPASPALSGSAAAFAASVGVGGAAAQATQLTNPSTTVTKGTLVPAVLETAINTDVPGYVRAVVSQDVRSFDGTKILIPRSSRLIGQYQSGVQQGQKRAYVIWEEVITPDGVVVRIGSPAVAFDGTTGLEGKVNSHFFKRFGSAMLLSVIGGFGAAVSGGTSVILGGAQQSIPDADISPTIRVKMGEPVRVFVSRNLDFSTVSD
ncbi:MAG: TrbI/VirB10 family protein [Pseudomonadota bacterium]